MIGEAGVGIGKSFAYIIPLLYYNKYFDKPIVISTSTIALQEQIFSDIAVASDLINYHPEVMNAKGQNHYVCRKRAAQLFSDKHLPGDNESDQEWRINYIPLYQEFNRFHDKTAKTG